MLQFHISKRLGTMYAWHGLAFAEPEGLRIVYRAADRPTEFLEDDCLKVVVPWSQVKAVHGQSGWWGRRVIIDLRPGTKLPEIPFLEEGSMRLEIHRSRADDVGPFAERAASFLQGAPTLDPETVIDQTWDMLHRHRGLSSDDPT